MRPTMKRLLNPDVKYDLSGLTNVETRVARPGGRCPFCGAVGVWRRGVHFDYDMRCDDCRVSWTPDEDVMVMTADDPTEFM